MALNLKKWFNIREGLQMLTDVDSSEDRYRLFQRNIRILMIVLTIVPLFMMALINYHQYQSGLKQEMIEPTKLLVSKTRHSFEFFLNERQSLIKSIAYFYSLNDLCDEKKLNHILFILKKEFVGFVDLGIMSARITFLERIMQIRIGFKKLRLKEHISAMYLWATESSPTLP